MSRIRIPVGQLEFEEGGNTLWVHSVNGTVLRLKVTGKISTEVCKVSPVLNGDLKICLSKDASK